jgi:hypothetical protein
VIQVVELDFVERIEHVHTAGAAEVTSFLVDWAEYLFSTVTSLEIQGDVPVV